jgi:hypothetical protein
MKSWMLAAARRFHLGLGGVQAGVQQVGADGVVEQVGFLRDHADLRAERFQGDIAQVVPVDQNAPGGWVVQARDQVGQGGFAGAAGPDQGHQLPGLARKEILRRATSRAWR